MRLTTRTNLAMRTLMFCAVNPGQIVRKHEVATACGASENHLAQVIHLLARKGYIKTQRGRSGGLMLARAPDAADMLAKTHIIYMPGPSGCDKTAVLQGLGAKALPPQHHTKTRVIYPSTGTRQTLRKTTRHLRVVMVGHLREEKDPLTLMAAAQRLPPGAGVFIDHIGAALDPALGQAAQATQAQCPHYRWLGAVPHAQTLQRIQRAHLLVHCSRMEGGAHVLMEAICSGTPVLASRIDGNVGLLSEDYAGYFEPGDAQALAHLLQACRSPQNGPSLMAHLRHQCALRAPLFEPQAERAALHRWVQDLWTI